MKQSLKVNEKSENNFLAWWAVNISSPEDLTINCKAKKLTTEVSDDCNDNLVSGWHTLIDCCFLLKSEGKIKNVKESNKLESEANEKSKTVKEEQ